MIRPSRQLRQLRVLYCVLGKISSTTPRKRKQGCTTLRSKSDTKSNEKMCWRRSKEDYNCLQRGQEFNRSKSRSDILRETKKNLCQREHCYICKLIWNYQIKKVFLGSCSVTQWSGSRKRSANFEDLALLLWLGKFLKLYWDFCNVYSMSQRWRRWFRVCFRSKEISTRRWRLSRRQSQK